MTDIITDIRQRHLEAFERALADISEDSVTTQTLSISNTVRVAIKAGWLPGFDEAALGDLTFDELFKLARAIREAYEAATHLSD